LGSQLETKEQQLSEHGASMIEALLFTQSVTLSVVLDAIDVYEGSIPPSATFQVIDVDNTTEVLSEPLPGDANVN